MDMTVLWDLDYVVYAAGFSVEHTERAIVVTAEDGETEFLGLFQDAKQAKARLEAACEEWPGQTARIYSTTYLEDQALERALHNARSMVEGPWKAIEARMAKSKKYSLGDVKYFLTGKNNFRESLATIRPYKGNRELTPKPVLYREIREYLIRTFEAQVCEGYEADDIIAVLAREGPAIVVHVDKDLDQIPGWHYNPNRQEFYQVRKPDALRFLYRQAISGDSVDNIPGAYKMGKRAAEDHIPSDMEDARSMWASALAAYESTYTYHGDRIEYADKTPEQVLTENFELVALGVPGVWRPECPPTSFSGGL